MINILVAIFSYFIVHILHKIMDGVFYACGIFNVFNVIDGSCILLSRKLNKWVIVVLVNYYFKQKKL